MSIYWLLNGEKLTLMSSSITTTQVGPRTSLLTISSTTAWHAGNYTCVAENRAGVTNYTVPVVIHGIVSVVI